MSYPGTPSTTGVQPASLQRRLGSLSVTSIVVANMIGAGIFTTSGLLMADLQSAWIMLTLWVVGGLIALCGALSYAELGAAIPEAGGEYVFLSRLFHPILGFLSGWVSLFAGFSAPIAASAIGCAEYSVRALPLLEDLGIDVIWLKKLFAIAIIAIFTAIHRRGLELGVVVQNTLTILKIGLIIALVGGGFARGGGSFAGLGDSGGLGCDLASLQTMGLALMWIMFAYSGWNAAAYIGSELHRPAHTMPRSLLAGTGLVIVLYLALNLFYLYALPAGEMAGEISVAGLAAARIFGLEIGAGISALVAFALFSSLSAFIILGPRVYYSMARDGRFFAFAGEVHPRFGVPSKSIILQGAIASLMVLLGSFDQILSYMGFSLGLFPILAVLGVFRVRKLGILAFRMPGFPIAPVTFIAASGAILILAFMERPWESSIAIAMVLIGLPVYLGFSRRRQRTSP